MRADRLISILLLLQQRKKITAQILAEEMGVSIRTIYRDMLALSASGFPVYAEKGPGGGCCIVEDFRSSIRTLSDDEINAMQILRIPEPLTKFSAGKDLQRALLKIMALIPERKHEPASLYIDWNAWPKSEKNERYGEIHSLNDACIHCKWVYIEYLMLNKAVIKQTVQPYGLVAKSGEWYLVYKLLDTYRFKNIASLEVFRVLDEAFEKTEGFDLEKTWCEITRDLEFEKYTYNVHLKIKNESKSILKENNVYIPFQVIERGEIDLNGWMDCQLRFEHLFSARAWILSWGGVVKVISPEPLRLSLLDFASQTIEANK